MTAKFLTRSAMPGGCKLEEEDERVGERTIKDFVLSHALRIPVTTEADDNESLLFGHDGLVNMPARD